MRYHTILSISDVHDFINDVLLYNAYMEVFSHDSTFTSSYLFIYYYL